MVETNKKFMAACSTIANESVQGPKETFASTAADWSSSRQSSGCILSEPPFRNE